MNYIINFETNDQDKCVIEQTLILPNYIKYAKMNYKDYHNIYYDSKSDTLSFESNKKIDYEQLLKYLYEPVSSKVLSNYHKQLINESPSINKEIDIQGSIDNKELCFNIEETKEKIVLTKIKRNKRNKYTNIVR